MAQEIGAIGAWETSEAMLETKIWERQWEKQRQKAIGKPVGKLAQYRIGVLNPRHGLLPVGWLVVG
jgi:hypothetical protein